MMDDERVPVWCDRVDYTGGTVAFGYGETEDGERVQWAGEPRAMYAIEEALENGDGPVLAAVPTWCMIRRPAPRGASMTGERRIPLSPDERAALIVLRFLIRQGVFGVPYPALMARLRRLAPSLPRARPPAARYPSGVALCLLTRCKPATRMGASS